MRKGMGFWIQSQLSHQPPVMLGEPVSSPACKIGIILLLVILTLEECCEDYKWG